MALALFYTQPTLNRLFNNCIKISSSWNLKKGVVGGQEKEGGEWAEKNYFQNPSLIRVKN